MTQAQFPSLLPQGSASDLVLRGHRRDQVLVSTGVDVGYNANSIKAELAGIDRWAYKLAHVEQRVDPEVVDAALTDYAACELDGPGVLAALGLANPTLVKLKKLFAQAAGGRWAQDFAEADRQHRRGTMTAGFAAKHDGATNPFQLEEYREQAALTRERRYGARYTLAAGSSLRAAALVRRRDSRAQAVPALLPEGSALDLAARGFGRDEILVRTGTDFGGNIGGAKPGLKGVDRCAYKIEHVRQRAGTSVVEELLLDYGAGETNAVGLMIEVGLLVGGAATATRQFTVKRLALGLGLGEQFEQARRQRVSSSEALARHRATVRERYGVDNVSQLAEVKERKKATSLTNYGSEHYLQSAEGKEAHRQVCQNKYGVDNVSALAEVKMRKARTSILNHGAPSYLESAECQTRLVVALRAQYGDSAVDAAIDAVGGQGNLRPFSVKGVLDHAATRCREVHGADNVFDLPQMQERIRSIIVDKYGVDNVSRSVQVQERRRQTFIERFGTDNPYQNEEVKAKIVATNLARYGFPMASMSEEVKAATLETKRTNGSFGASGTEDALHEALIAKFGADDVVRQHRDVQRYRFACDFYIPSRDLFIEVNGSWTHGDHWYDGDDEVDQAVVESWLNKGGQYYTAAVQVWTERDVAKRASAAEHKLNYVVLWDGSAALLDAKLWIAMGCPDGRDWEREYSWLPARTLDLDGDWPMLSARPRAATAIARRANWRSFYARELVLWGENATSSRRWGTAQARLYANRLEHMGSERGTGKLPDELSDLEILRGLGISGAVRAHTVFDNSAMVTVLTEHAVRSVVDPCAGWGERLVTCAALGIAYRGTDVNLEVVAGHRAIIEHYGLSEQRSEVGDAASVDRRDGDHEAVFTCPPYGSTEIYTAAGAENLDEQAFLDWWARAVAMSTAPTTRLFAYQVNSAWRERMNAVLAAAGWQQIQSVACRHRSGHFTRTGGVDRKAAGESVEVFVRAGDDR